MNDPTPQDMAEYHEMDDFRKLTPDQRDVVVRLHKEREQQEEWADQNRDWIGDHMELWDAE